MPPTHPSSEFVRKTALCSATHCIRALYRLLHHRSTSSASCATSRPSILSWCRPRNGMVSATRLGLTRCLSQSITMGAKSSNMHALSLQRRARGFHSTNGQRLRHIIIVVKQGTSTLTPLAIPSKQELVLPVLLPRGRRGLDSTFESSVTPES